MRLRSFAVALGLFFVPSSAYAQEVVPLTGTGENVAPIARLKFPGAVTEVALAGDWAFVAAEAREETCGCLYIVNIADPARPFIQGVWDAAKTDLNAQSYGDVDISPDANLAVLTNAKGSGPTWDVLIDTTDKSNPKMISHVDDLDGSIEYVHTSTLDNDMLYLNPQVWAGFPQPGHAAITVVDISDPANPKQVGKITTPGADAGLAHDTFIDHRPDGKTLMYAASITKSDVIDITDPLDATWLQSTTAPDITISHDVQPNHDRTVLLVDDEGAAGGQIDPSVSACGKVGSGPATVNSGSLHFYEAAPDGTFANEGLNRLGTFNTPPNVLEAECVAHVFWLAPDQNRLTQAYYNIGAWVIDFSDPANATALGHLDADGATYWSAKPHNGYIYATNMSGTLDVMRYTGEGGTAWPATSGPAEVQHSAYQGVPYVPIKGTTPQPTPTPTPTDRTFGRFSLKIKTRKLPKGRSGEKARLKLVFRDSAGKAVGRVRIKRSATRKAKVRITGTAVTGTYRWVLKAGKRKLKAGRITVGVVEGLQSSSTFTARVRRR